MCPGEGGGPSFHEVAGTVSITVSNGQSSAGELTCGGRAQSRVNSSHRPWGSTLLTRERLRRGQGGHHMRNRGARCGEALGEEAGPTAVSSGETASFTADADELLPDTALHAVKLCEQRGSRE